jgi:RpiR family transcriptional regulator, carbohydrate utilization regulator
MLASFMSEAHQNILEIVRVMLDTLRKSDRKVAAAILADPPRFLGATVAETATIAGVSQPTVIRFCAAIGCGGFQDFRLRLAQALALGTPATHSVLLESDGPGTVFDKIFDYTITSLDWARNRIDKESLADAVDLLVAAKGIEFFGFGASGIVALDAQQKFPLFGVPCGAQTDAHQQIMTASLMDPTQVAIVISNTGSTRSIIEIADLARGSGAKVIGLVGNTSPLMAHCDVSILIETLDNTDVYTPTISRIAALTVIDVLSTAVAMRRDPAQRSRIAAMKQQLRDLRSA